jgi:hypothetical protein
MISRERHSKFCSHFAVDARKVSVFVFFFAKIVGFVKPVFPRRKRCERTIYSIAVAVAYKMQCERSSSNPFATWEWIMRRTSMGRIIAEVRYFFGNRLRCGYTVQSGSEERQREEHSYLIVVLQEIYVSMIPSWSVFLFQSASHSRMRARVLRSL